MEGGGPAKLERPNSSRIRKQKDFGLQPAKSSRGKKSARNESDDRKSLDKNLGA